jgi:hypothetical protein
MGKNSATIDDCLEKLRKLESEYEVALNNLDMGELSFLRQKIKQLKEKLRTEKRFN